ncbi:hypothetical protein JOM56_002299 [Amanita muscaria]
MASHVLVMALLKCWDLVGKSDFGWGSPLKITQKRARLSEIDNRPRGQISKEAMDRRYSRWATMQIMRIIEAAQKAVLFLTHVRLFRQNFSRKHPSKKFKTPFNHTTHKNLPVFSGENLWSNQVVSGERLKPLCEQPWLWQCTGEKVEVWHQSFIGLPIQTI